MSCKPRHNARPAALTSSVALTLGLLLSACGGGGGGSSHVASTPPPPAAPAPSADPTLVVRLGWLESPVTRNGTYDTIGRLTLTPGNGDPTSYRAVAPGEFTVSSSSGSSATPFSYSLHAPAAFLPGGHTSLDVARIATDFGWTINLPPAQSSWDLYGDYTLALGQHLTAFSKAPDGTETLFLSDELTRGIGTGQVSLDSASNLQTTLLYDIGYSHVAMGEWSWRVVDLNGTAAGDFGELLFVNGDRTPSTGIPASGTATYDARSLALLSESGTRGIPFTLTADFGQRTMATVISQNYLYDPSSISPTEPILGIHVAGSAPFNNNGSFAIPLTGTVNYAHSAQPVTPLPEAVTGTMNGGFFGPQAEQIGGVFSLERPNSTLLLQDAFVGKQRQP